MAYKVLPFLSRIERNWFWASFTISVVLVATYFALHCWIDGEQKKVSLSSEQLELARTILNDPAYNAANLPDSTINGDSLRKVRLEHYLYLTLDIPTSNTGAVSDQFSITQTLESFSINELKLLLPNISFTVPSVFWLSGKMSLLEVIFWALFGLAASVLYRVTEAIRDKEFNARKIPIHIAKLVYAPLSTMVVVFSISLWTADRGEAFIGISNGLVIGSFILGFFSGRTVDLLKRIKDILLPLGNDNTMGESAQGPIYQLRGMLQIWTPNGSKPATAWQSASVRISSLDSPGRTEQIVRVFEDGSFELPYLRAGKYLLTAQLSIDQILYKQQQTIDVSKDQEDQELVIYLKELYSYEPHTA